MTDMMIWEDFEYLVRILLQRPRIEFASEGLLFYRVNANAKRTPAARRRFVKTSTRPSAFSSYRTF